MSAEQDLERVAYLGRRTAGDGKLSHAWSQVDEHDQPVGEPLVYGKVKGTAIGGIYLLHVAARDENGRPTSAYRDPVYTGDRRVAGTQLAEWVALDEQARTREARAAAERSLARKSGATLDDAIAEAVEMIKAARTGAARHALEQAFTNRLREAVYS